MNDRLDYKGSGSARAYANDVIAHSATPSIENARKMATMRSSLKSAYNELLTLDNDITKLGNQLLRADISTKNNAKAAALDSKYKNIRATAMSKYSQWKTKYAAFKTLLNEYKRLNPSGSGITDYDRYIKMSFGENDILMFVFENEIPIRIAYHQVWKEDAENFSYEILAEVYSELLRTDIGKGWLKELDQICEIIEENSHIFEKLLKKEGI